MNRKEKLYDLYDNGVYVTTKTSAQLAKMFHRTKAYINNAASAGITIDRRYAITSSGNKLTSKTKLSKEIQKKKNKKIEAEIERIIQFLDLYGNTITKLKPDIVLPNIPKNIKVAMRQSTYDKHYIIERT